MKKFWTMDVARYINAMNMGQPIAVRGNWYKVRSAGEQFNASYGCMMGRVELVAI